MAPDRGATGFVLGIVKMGDQISHSGTFGRLLHMQMKPFEAIVKAHGPVILRVCRAMLGPDDADDAWSDTFLAALRAYPDLRPDSNIEAWLVTIAHRKALDRIRVRDRDRRLVAALPVPDRQAPPAFSDVWDALRELPFKQRAAVAYHHLVGLPYAEIAPLLGNSEDAARRAAADGIKTLRTMLGKGDER